MAPAGATRSHARRRGRAPLGYTVGTQFRRHKGDWLTHTSPPAREDKPYSLARRLAGWALILVVSLSCFFAAMALTGGFGGAEASETTETSAAPADPAANGFTPAQTLVFLVGFLIFAGGFGFVLGVTTYTLTLATCAFTFDFTRPVFRGFTRRLWVCNIIAPMGFMVAIAAGLTLLLLGPLVLLGAPPEPAAAGVAITSFILLQFASAWINLWQPIERRLIHRRLQARGVSLQLLTTGRPMGTSDPAQNTLKRFVVEQDVGLLWITPTELRFVGDSNDWAIDRTGVVAIDRTTDAGSMVSYAGGRQTVVRHLDAAGRESVTRLHPQGAWTITGKKLALDTLATELEAWRTTPTAVEQPAPV